MAEPLFQSYAIEDRSYVSFIKREIHNTSKTKFSETRTGEIDIVVSEVCSNLIKHAGGGELLYRFSGDASSPELEILCIDSGPGIADLAHVMRDGVSSTNTLGHGLGAITRLSTFSQVYSVEGWGTIVYARFTAEADEPRFEKKNITIRCLNVAKPGERVSGDGFAVKVKDEQMSILVADGLGHGKHAHEAAQQAIEAFMASTETVPSAIIREVHQHSKKTRGLVGTVVLLDRKNKTWHLCGVGNIHSRMQHGLASKTYICNNGIIGLNLPSRLEDFVIDLERYQQMILCSDGIKTRFDLMKYPSILKYDPMVLAACIYKDFARKTDDMTVVIIKLL